MAYLQSQTSSTRCIGAAAPLPVLNSYPKGLNVDKLFPRCWDKRWIIPGRIKFDDFAATGNGAVWTTELLVDPKDVVKGQKLAQLDSPIEEGRSADSVNGICVESESVRTKKKNRGLNGRRQRKKRARTSIVKKKSLGSTAAAFTEGSVSSHRNSCCEDPFIDLLELKWQAGKAEDPFFVLMDVDATSKPLQKAYREDPFVTVMDVEKALPEYSKWNSLLKSKFIEEPWLLETPIAVPVGEERRTAADVNVEIYINSSECTMQRIAIVEDKKLVQLLLEPVDTNFQLGNVYLGVVKQLLPSMNGIFVDIGPHRTALLEVNKHHHPYAFTRKSDRENGSIIDAAAGKIDLGDSSLELNELSGDDGEEDYDTDDVASRKNISTKLTALLKKTGNWERVSRGMMIIAQVKKESLRQKGPQLTASIALAGRFWVLLPHHPTVGITRNISGMEKVRLKKLAKELQPAGFGLTARTEALGRNREELEKDLTRLMATWEQIVRKAEAAAASGDDGEDNVAPMLLHRAMGQTLRTVRDIFNDKVQRFVVDSSQTYHEVQDYLQEVAPHLCERVELYSEKEPIFDAFNLEEQIEKSSSKRVGLPNGAYLVLEETEALVTIDVNGGGGMLGKETSHQDAVLEVNLAAARQIATELRIRDIGGIIVVDFIDMENPDHQMRVCDEMRKAIERDRSAVAISEISEFGLMEMTRARERQSVTSTISDTCACCGGSGRIESIETTLSKIERAVKRILVKGHDYSTERSKWPEIMLRVDTFMFDYLNGRGRRRIHQLNNAFCVLLTVKVAPDLARGNFSVSKNGIFITNQQQQQQQVHRIAKW